MRSCIKQSPRWGWAAKPGLTEDLDAAEAALISAIQTNAFVSELFGTPMQSMKKRFKDSLESEASKVADLVNTNIVDLDAEVKHLHAMHHARPPRKE